MTDCRNIKSIRYFFCIVHSIVMLLVSVLLMFMHYVTRNCVRIIPKYDMQFFAASKMNILFTFYNRIYYYSSVLV